MFVDDAQAYEFNCVGMGTRRSCHVLSINQLQEEGKNASSSKFLHADSIAIFRGLRCCFSLGCALVTYEKQLVFFCFLQVNVILLLSNKSWLNEHHEREMPQLD